MDRHGSDERDATGGLDRRRFLRLVAAGSVYGMAASAGARLPEDAPAGRRGGHGPGRGRVALVATDDRARGVGEAVALLGVGLPAGSVAIKPNFNSADPAPGSTHPDVLRALVRALAAAGARVTVADRSGMGDTRRVMTRLGVPELATALGFETVVLDELGADGWERVTPPGAHWQSGFPFARLFREADAVVQACCLKTHRFGGHFTLSLKNSVGMVAKTVPGDGHDYMQELHGSPHQRRMIAEINAAYRPALVVMDAVDAFATGGPESGRKVHPGLVLASTDRVAIDAVGVAILRHFGTTPEVSRGPVFAQEQLARAVELGLGAASAAEVELVTSGKEAGRWAERIRGQLSGA